MKVGKRLLFFICVFFFCELLARYAFDFYPSEMYQKYYQEKKNGVIIKRYNGRGAIGDAYKGQLFKMAVIGNSQAVANTIHFKDKIFVQLKNILGEEKVHIDNFSIGNAHLQSALKQLKTLKRLGRRYDVILMCFFGETLSVDDDKQYHYYYSRRWMKDEQVTPSVFWNLLQKFLKRRKIIEKYTRLFSLNPIIRYLGIKSKPEQVTPIIPKIERKRFDRELRQSSFVLQRLVDFRIPKENPAKQRIQNAVVRVKTQGEKITDNIYWGDMKKLWHPKMKKSYEINYVSIIPAQDFKSNDPEFLSSEGLYKKTLFETQALIDAVKKQEMKMIPFTKYAREKMPEEENLTPDNVHVTAKGAKYIAEGLADYFRPLVENKIKNQNK